MSKYIEWISLADIDRVELYINKNRKALSAIMKETGADYAMNGGFFSGSTSLCNVKSGGTVVNDPQWNEWGFAWDSGSDMAMGLIPCGKKNYLGCVCLIRPGFLSKPAYNTDVGGKRGRAAMGIAGDKLVLYCSNDGADASTPEALQAELSALGCDSALMLDGGGSSQCDFAGKIIKSCRVVANLLLVYLKKKGDKPLHNGKTVVLDAGHGTQSANRSPDGAYNEAEFALDMAKRMKAILERHGVSVAMTRTGESCPTGKGDEGDLAYRCRAANAISGLDLFVSLHSNAAGSGGWNTARGWSIYTSSAGAAAGRNIAANKIIDRVKEAGIHMRSAPLVHSMLYVLKHTTAPAVLIEHGFHTNKEDTALLKDGAYRQKLAEAQGKGILDYLGVAWKEETGTEAPRDEASPWAKESWEKAVKGGLFDGTSPQGALTREMAAVLLERLNLL